MAADHHICISVLEGALVSLREVGRPLPVYMQDKGAQPESAQWTAKQTKLGFSVCFFWPVQEAVVIKSRKPRRKRSAKANRSTESPAIATLDPAEAEERQPPRTMRATIDAHHPGKAGHKPAVPVCSSTASVDLKEFSDGGEPLDEIDRPGGFRTFQGCSM